MNWREAPLSKGVLLYEMFQARPPYNTRKLPSLRHLIESQPVLFYKTIDARLKALIKKLLQKNPLKRPSSREVLADAGLHALLRKHGLSPQAFLDLAGVRKRNREGGG